MEDARTNTTLRPYVVQATTSGTPAASLGVGVLFRAESADENPAEFGALDFIGTDVAAGTEDTVVDILLRTAGAALGARYRFQSTGAFLYTLTGAPTAARTITFPDSDVTLAPGLARAGGSATEATTTSVTAVTLRDITGLNIAVGTPVKVVVWFRTSTSAAGQTASLGLTVNGSALMGPVAVTVSSTGAADGIAEFLLNSATSYNFGVMMQASSQTGGSATNTTGGADASLGAVTITSIQIRGLVSDTSKTLAVNHVQVYTLPVS